MSGSPLERSPNPHRTIGSAEQRNKVNQYEMFDLQLQSLFDEGQEKKDSSTTTIVQKREIDSKLSSSRASEDISMSRSQSTQNTSRTRSEDWDVELGYPLGNIRVDTTFEIASHPSSPVLAQPTPAVVRSHPSRPEDLGLLPVISEGSYLNPVETRKDSIT